MWLLNSIRDRYRVFRFLLSRNFHLPRVDGVEFHIPIKKYCNRTREGEKGGKALGKVIAELSRTRTLLGTLFIIGGNPGCAPHARNEAERSRISGVSIYDDVRTSLRTGWRTVGHGLGLRLRRALAHGCFDTSSIFHRSGVGNTRPPLPAASRSSVAHLSDPCATRETRPIGADSRSCGILISLGSAS